MAAADPADATPSDGETVLADLELTRGLALQMTAVGLLGLVVSWGVLAALYLSVVGHGPSLALGPAGVGWWTDALNLLVLAVLATAFVVPHEWLHGLAIRYYGGEPRYGVGVAHFVLPYAYATTDHEFTRNQFLVVLLTPLVVLTALGVAAMLAFELGWLIVPLAANAAGAVADVWMAVTLLGYPAHVRLQDHAAGVRILGRSGDAQRSPSITAVAWDALAGAAVASVGTLLVLAVAGPLLLPVLGVDRLAVGTPGTPTFLFAFANTPEEISLSVGSAVLLVGAVLGLGYAFVRSYRRSSGGDVAEPVQEPADDR